MTEGKIVTWLKNVGDKVGLLLFSAGVSRGGWQLDSVHWA
jgi:hypothetical protein